MHLLDLPLEVFRAILEMLVRSSLSQSMRVRIVCKYFNAEILQALYSTRVLESPERVDCETEPSVLTGYLFALAQTGHSTKYSALVTVHNTVDYLLEKMPSERHNRPKFMHKLCELLVDRNEFIHLSPDRRDCNTLEYALKPPTRAYNINQNGLAAAICCGLVPLAKIMMSTGDTDGSSFFGSPISLAVKANNLELVRFLLEKGYKNFTRWEPAQAARHGNMAMLDLLLDRVQDDHFEEALFYNHAFQGAATGGHVEVIRFLVQKASSPARHELPNGNDKYESVLRNGRSALMDGALIKASLYGHTELVGFILDDEVYSKARALKNKTTLCRALISAAGQGYTEIVILLLNKMETTPRPALQQAITDAAKGGWVGTTQMLFDRGVRFEVNQESSQYRLLSVVKTGQVEMIELLLDRYVASWKTQTGACSAAYLWAVSHGYTSIASHFIRHGLDASHPVKQIDSERRSSDTLAK